jgi:hypothetical protein
VRARPGFSRHYGSGPAHAGLMAGSFALAGYVATRILDSSQPVWIAIWLAGAIVAHDLVLYPLYSLADRLVVSLRRRPERPAPAVPWTNHMRVPAVISGLLLLLTFPLVTGLSERGYVSATGLHTSVYLGRWLAVSGATFGASLAVYAARRLAHRIRSGP